MDNINNSIKPRYTGQAEASVVVEVGLSVISKELGSGRSKGKIMVKHNSRQDYAEYLEGDSWKCSKSPTRAHHWIVGSETICKYCLMAKQVQTAVLAGFFVMADVNPLIMRMVSGE
jgi:hypothetical protein